MLYSLDPHALSRSSIFMNNLIEGGANNIPKPNRPGSTETNPIIVPLVNVSQVAFETFALLAHGAYVLVLMYLTHNLSLF